MLCYKSYRRSIEQAFEPVKLAKGIDMAIAAPFPAARAPRVIARPASADRHVRSTGGGLRLTRRGRVALGVLSALMLLLVVLASGRFSADAGTSIADQGRATGVVVVQPGESLWQIAQSVAPQADPRATVTVIRELNALGDAPVRPGQSIVVPVGPDAA